MNQRRFLRVLAPLSGALVALIFLRSASCRAQNAPAALGKDIPADAVQKIGVALPQSAQVRPAKPRRLLVFTLARGFVHSSIPYGARALQMMGAKTGAFTSTESSDIAMLEPRNLRNFDAICLVSTTGTIFERADLKKSLLDFVSSGKGFIGIHAATDAFYDTWPEYGQMIGGYFVSHPWNAGETVSVRVENPNHPLNRAFGGKGSFEVTDEIYQFKAPYARDRQRVLLSLDMNKTEKKGAREDNDYPVSWIKNYGRGRVFYCSLGHREDIYWNPAVLRHYLAGIQFALGDLKADTTPVPQPAGPIAQTPAGIGDATMGEYAGTLQWNGARAIRAEAKVIAEGGGNYRAVLTAPMGAVRGRLVRLEMSGKVDASTRTLSGKAQDLEGSATLAAGALNGTIKVAGSDAVRFSLRKVVRHSPTEGMKPPLGATVLLPYAPGTPPSLSSWTNQNWIPMTDGSVQVRSGETKTRREFGDMRLHLEYMTPFMPEARGQARGNSGVYLQNRYEVQVLDSFGLPPQNNEAGGIYTIAAPRANASLPPLAWQTYDILFRAPRLDAAGKVLSPARVTMWHNGIQIHKDQALPNSTGGGEGGFVARGPLKLQDHNDAVRYRNIWVVETGESALMHSASTRTSEKWRVLFDGTDMAHWETVKEGSWKIENGALAVAAGGDIYTKEQFGDFVLDLEAKVEKGGNSGVFVRAPDPRDWFSGIEIQVFDSFGKAVPDKHDAGAVYDVVAPSRNVTKAPGEWNRYTITARGPQLLVAMNGEQVVEMNLDRWTQAGKNPDGTPNKFKAAYKDMPRRGHIAFQHHGDAVWYRNVRIRELN